MQSDGHEDRQKGLYHMCKESSSKVKRGWVVVVVAAEVQDDRTAGGLQRECHAYTRRVEIES